jgi:hypothetical protein
MNCGGTASTTWWKWKDGHDEVPRASSRTCANAVAPNRSGPGTPAGQMAHLSVIGNARDAIFSFPATAGKDGSPLGVVAWEFFSGAPSPPPMTFEVRGNAVEGFLPPGRGSPQGNPAAPRRIAPACLYETRILFGGEFCTSPIGTGEAGSRMDDLKGAR